MPYATRQKALACLIDILERNQHEKPFPNQMTKVDFMNLALESIQNQQSVFTAINFLMDLIKTFPRESHRNYNQGYGGRGNPQPEIQVETRERVV